MAQNAPPHITDRTQGHLPGFEMPVFQFLRLKQTKTRFLCKTKKETQIFCGKHVAEYKGAHGGRMGRYGGTGGVMGART